MKFGWILILVISLGMLGCGGGDDAGMGKDDTKTTSPPPTSGTSTEGNSGPPDSVSPDSGK